MGDVGHYGFILESDPILCVQPKQQVRCDLSIMLLSKSCSGLGIGASDLLGNLLNITDTHQ